MYIWPSVDNDLRDDFGFAKITFNFYEQISNKTDEYFIHYCSVVTLILFWGQMSV